MELFNINLVDPFVIKKISPEIPDSVDDALMAGFIIDVQEAFVETLLGCNLYNQILLEHSGNTLTTVNKYIYDRYIVKIIAKRVAIRTMYSSSYQFENGGIRVKESEQSRVADSNEIVALKQFYESESDRLSKDLVNYINYHIEDYPLFYTSTYYVCDCKTNSAFKTRIKIQGF